MIDMKEFMRLVVKEDGKVVGKTPISDPFHTTRVLVDQRMSWLSIKDWWRWLLMPFRGFQTEIIVKVEADEEAIRHWFSRGLKTDALPH